MERDKKLKKEFNTFIKRTISIEYKCKELKQHLLNTNLTGRLDADLFKDTVEMLQNKNLAKKYKELDVSIYKLNEDINSLCKALTTVPTYLYHSADEFSRYLTSEAIHKLNLVIERCKDVIFGIGVMFPSVGHKYLVENDGANYGE